MQLDETSQAVFFVTLAGQIATDSSRYRTKGQTVPSPCT